MTKTEKRVLFGLILVMFIHTIFNYKTEGVFSIIKFVGGVALYMLPLLFNLLFKYKLTVTVRYIYYVFIFFAYYVGNIMHGYTWPNYDTIMHFISGILTSFLGIIILTLFKRFQNKDYKFNVVFILFTSLAVAALWEIIEFSGDQLFGANMQRVETGVVDTMKDIIVAFIGSFLFIIWYLYEEITNTKLFITKFVKEIRDFYG